MPLKRFRSNMSQHASSQEDDESLPDLDSGPKRPRVTTRVMSQVKSSSTKRQRMTRQQLRAQLKAGPGPQDEVIELDPATDSDATIITSTNEMTAEYNSSTSPVKNGVHASNKDVLSNAAKPCKYQISTCRSKSLVHTVVNQEHHLIDISSENLSDPKIGPPSSCNKRSTTKAVDALHKYKTTSRQQSPNSGQNRRKPKVQNGTQSLVSNFQEIASKPCTRQTGSKLKNTLVTSNITSEPKVFKAVEPNIPKESHVKTRLQSLKTSSAGNSKKPSGSQHSFKPANATIQSVQPSTSKNNATTSSPSQGGQEGNKSVVEVIDLCETDDDDESHSQTSKSHPSHSQTSKANQRHSQTSKTKSPSNTDTIQPVIYENGVPDRINPNIDPKKLDPRFKRLLEQKKPVMKKIAELSDVSQCHYVITDFNGNISKENDSVAQFIIDIGLIVKKAGKELIADGMRLQHEIATMRADEQVQLKQEIDDDNNSAVDNMKPENQMSPKAAAANSAVPTFRAGGKGKRRPQTAEEKLKRCHVCQICGESFTKPENLQTHLNKHAACLIRCTDCGRSFYSSERHHKHKQAHLHGFQTCSYCEENFDTLKGLRAHVKRHEGTKWVCNIDGCKKPYADKNNYINHIQYGHQNQRTVPCDLCPKFFKSPNVVRSHKYRDHK